jgi:integrase
MKGSVYKRCGCTAVGEDGKRRQLGRSCPKLKRPDGSWNPRHGTWAFAVSVTGPYGKRQQIVRGGFATSAEAQAELDATKGKIAKGRVINDRLTVGEYLRDWINSKHDIRPNTRKSYEGHIERYFEPYIGHLRLTELGVHHVADVLTKVGTTTQRVNRNGRPRKVRVANASTVQRVRATLRTALGDAMRQRLVDVNVAALVKLPSGKRPKALVWTAEREAQWRATGRCPSSVMVWRPDQLGAFLDHAASDRLYALWHLLAHRGLRRGEACGLEWSDVDLTTGTATIRTQRITVGGEVLEGDPKSEAGGRMIALGTEGVAELKAHRTRQLQDRLAWGEAWTDSGKVFVKEDGSALHPAAVSDQFERLIEEADLPPIRLHDLRHGAASLMLAAGIDLKVVQETLGHANLSTTANTYTSVYQDVAQAAAEAVSAIVPRKRAEDRR